MRAAFKKAALKTYEHWWTYEHFAVKNEFINPVPNNIFGGLSH